MTGIPSPIHRSSLLLAAFLAAGMACALPGQAPSAPREQELNGGFTIARLKYKGGGDWYSDESALRNLLRGIKERGEIRVSQDQEAVVTPTDPEIWNYPMLFMTGHGNVKLSEEETRALRSYLDSGGFLWADDNFGMDKSFRELLKRLYPDAPLTELPFGHAIFRYPNSFPSGAPKIHEHDGGPPRVYAVMKGGRVRVLYTFDCDIGNGLEDAGVHDDPPEKRLAAMRFAINVATYAVTH